MSLSDRRQVLTSASCVEGASSVQVLSGAHDLNNDAEQIHWQRANAFLPGQVHPQYNPDTHIFDAVLLDIDSPFEYDSN